MSDLYYSYEEDFAKHTQDLRGRLAKVAEAKDEKAALSACQRLLGEAEQCLKQMELEARTIPGKANELKPRVADHRRAFDTLARELREKKGDHEKRMLLSDDGRLSGGAVEQRQRLLGVEDKIKQSTKEVENAHRMALETEQVSVDIMGNLHTQRETIDRMRANMRDVGDGLNTARRTIGRMGQRMLKNRMMLYGIAVFVFIAIVYILWISIFG
eukprot:GDKI01038514.1.p1 GENE.GDKI01038514.1~~GDKI01038514.1.p1  ORF type:complete len:214 (-),score=76.08 GDKI01038514.1:285-926(-)